jgi:hypothetical protein
MPSGGRGIWRMGAGALVRELRDHSFFFHPTVFSDLPVALVGNFVIGRKHTFYGLKAYLRPPLTIPLAILLVDSPSLPPLLKMFVITWYPYFLLVKDTVTVLTKKTFLF